MDFIKSANSNSNRYVIEDSIPKVTSDGEPHEVMTMVAAFSGVIAAVVVLVILIMLIGCWDSNRQTQQNSDDEESQNQNQTKPNSIIPVFRRHASFDGQPQLMSISTISTSACYDNSACIADEEKGLTLNVINLPGITTVRF